MIRNLTTKLTQDLYGPWMWAILQMLRYCGKLALEIMSNGIVKNTFGPFSFGILFMN